MSFSDKRCPGRGITHESGIHICIECAPPSSPLPSAEPLIEAKASYLWRMLNERGHWARRDDTGVLDALKAIEYVLQEVHRAGMEAAAKVADETAEDPELGPCGVACWEGCFHGFAQQIATAIREKAGKETR